MERKPLVVGNWKMMLSHKASLEVVRSIQEQIRQDTIASDVVMCPSYSVLSSIADMLQGQKKIQLGAQNVSEYESGPYTGQVSAMQLRDLVGWCIVGHSEVRSYAHESDDRIAAKIPLLLQQGIVPLVCIGETEEEKASDMTLSRIREQVDSILRVVDRAELVKIVLCYEPVWAISSNRTMDAPDPQEISGMSMLIRKHIAQSLDSKIAQRMRIMYGGSVDESSAGSYVAEPGVDGVLVGSASVHPLQFADIIRSVQNMYQE